MKVYDSQPEELIPTEKDVGRMVECSDYKYPSESLRLYSLDSKKDVVTVVCLRGFYSYRLNQVILHRDEDKRDRTDRVVSSYRIKKKYNKKKKRR